MARVTFDLDVLRSFVAGIELGSFSKAADAQGRSASAISTQMHKLEEQVGALLLKKAGRGLVLTDAGETMLAYARRMLELNDEAVSAVQGHRREGWVRLAVGPDFGDGLLTDILSRFAERFPGEKIDTRIMRTSELVEALHSGKVDVGLAWDTGVITKNHKVIGSVPLRWIASADHPVPWSPGSDAALPLISMEAPCLMRSWATAALDRAGIVWRHNFVSSSLTGLWAATAAGMGISARTTLGLTGRVRVLGEDCTLPELPSLDVIVCRRGQGLSPVAEALANIVEDVTHQHVTPIQPTFKI